VGDTLEAVLEDGDRLRVCRGGTADLGITVFRGGRFMLALGAVGHMGLGAGIALEEDPRAAEVDLYWLASIVDPPDTTLVWLDRSSSDFESRFEACQHGPMNVRVILAVKDADDLTRKRLNDLMVLGTLSTASCYCEYIDSRFQNGTEWAAYLRGLPKTRPKDLFIRITVDGVTSTVREGEYAFTQPWHLYVARVFTPGIPGELSQLAIARERHALTAKMLLDSTLAISQSSGTRIVW